MMKGQRAMVAAKINSLTINEFGKKQQLAESFRVSRSYVAQASLVLQYAPELAEGVIAGTIGLKNPSRSHRGDQHRNTRLGRRYLPT